MRAVIRIGAFAIIACASAGPAVAQSSGSNTCKLEQPPNEAVRRVLPGGMAEIKYPDPRTVPNNYTGCLNTWLEGVGPPVLIAVAKFKDGVTESVRIPAYGLDCAYENNRLVDDPARRGTCLDAKDVTLEKWRIQ